MISKINHIKNFGVFKNFQGKNLSDFKTFNLIYGWNYSGKTTLSRIFRCFEIEKIHEDYSESTFELANENNAFDQKLEASPQIRVFNADFVKDNLKWDQDHFEPIFLLGQKNIELQNELEALNTVLSSQDEKIAQIKVIRDTKFNLLNGSLTDQARTVSQLLSLRNFDRTALTQLIEKIKPEWDSYILNDKEFNQLKSQAISNEEKPFIDNLVLGVPSITSLQKEASDLLEWTSNSQKIEILLTNPALSKWVDDGRHLHDDKTECQFCRQKLPLGLLESINNHFSKEFDEFKFKANNLYVRLKASEIAINESQLAETGFYSTLRLEFLEAKKNLDKVIKVHNGSVKLLMQDLKLKSENPFNVLQPTHIEYDVMLLASAIETLNILIDSNNTLTSNFQGVKAKALDTIKHHFAAEFAKAKSYTLVKAQIEEADQEILTVNEQIGKTKTDILAIQNHLSETVKGAEQINTYLKQFFGKDDIHIKATDDKRFKLLRGEILAKNLSEGEKTAIAFAYFITKLSEKDLQLCNTIIYIDDPISSLDANHLFNIFAFIKSQFYTFTKGGNPKHKGNCLQLFISTHNLEFHYLLADWLGKLPKDMHAFYHIERHFNEKKDESIIKDGTWKLGKFKSEYVYLFSLMYAFQQNPSLDFDNYYHLPNIMRRFTETYLNFKYQSVSQIDENIADLITDAVECERARKFMHYYSHGLSTNKFMRNTDLQESQAVVNSLLDAVGKHDPIHYKSLIETVTAA